MTTDNIRINDYPLLKISQLDVNKRVNSHATMSLSGSMAGDVAEQLLSDIARTQSLRINATSTEGTDYVLFTGIPDQCKLTTENNTALLTLTATSHSALCDVRPEIRVFQDRRMSYSEMFEYLAAADAGYIIPGNADKSIGALLVQYRETDWQYARRMASRLGTVVVPDCSLNHPYLSVGIPQNGGRYEADTTNYGIEKDLEEFWRLRKNGMKSISENDVTGYRYKSRSHYRLCDKISFNGMDTLVYSVHSSLEGSMLFHTCLLRTESGFRDFEHFNERIIGAAIHGFVKDIQEDQVKVKLQYDVSDRRRKWFAYSTPYSSPDGTGWYFMPEKNDEIRLHFPTQREQDAYVASSTHITHGDRADPEVKFIRTKRGQAITFKPESIHITDGNGSHILMDKEKGILITTNKGIRVAAADSIRMAAQGKINVSGEKGVQIRQNDSIIHVDETIDISASHVRIQ